MQRIALVTGANRGIGLEICRELAQQGLHVILTARDAKKGEAAVSDLKKQGLDVSFCDLDVADPESIEGTRRHVEAKYGRLDVLVNNAGVYPDESISVLELPLATLQQTFAINTIGPLLMIQAFVPMMQTQKYGRIVNVSSDAGVVAWMGGYLGAYKMSKAALNALTRVVADELRDTNIKVNAMCPGWVATDMGGASAPRTVAEGADTAIWLATLPDDGPTDGFWRDRQPLNW